MSSAIGSPALIVPVSPGRDHIRGPVDAPVVLLEYGDYQCPYCAEAHRVVDAIQAQLPEGLAFVFRHFPMTTIHPFAEQAAEAAEAAGAQGRFWAMHATMYENQEQLDLASLENYAQALGLDLNQFTDDLATHRHAGKITGDFTSGVRSGVNGTPTFYINGVRHDGGWDFVSLAAAIRSAVPPAVDG